MTLIKDRTAIAGIGQTEFAKALDRSEKRLALEAIELALDDAGIDAVARSTGWRRTRSRPPRKSRSPATSVSATSRSSARSATAAAPAAAWSATPRWRSPPASATSPSRGAAASAARRRAGRGRKSAPASRQHQWTRPFGLLRPVDEIAVLARRYFHEFGGTREQLAIGRGRGSPSRQPQPRGDDAREADDRRAVPRRAMGLRAAVPLRQLPRVRRCGRGRHHVDRAGA